MTNTEANYVQIEIKLLSIVFAMEKFHHNTFALHFMVQSDHKPLETIVPGPLWKSPKRLQAMKVRLQKHDITVKYHKGKEMHIADTLSRAYIPEAVSGKENIIDVNVIQHISVSLERIKEIQHHTATDDTLQVLCRTIIQGWPESTKNVPPAIDRYTPYRNELSFTDGLILRGDKIVIPHALRKKMLEQEAHGPHCSPEKNSSN